MKGEEISRFIDESKEYLAKGDAVQASEKLYKAAEECIKVLAQRYKLPEHEEAGKISYESGRKGVYDVQKHLIEEFRVRIERGICKENI